MWPFKKKAPHEIMPVLLEWKPEDNVKILTNISSTHYIYMGCDGTELIFKSTESPYPIKRVTPRSLEWNYSYTNSSYEIRKANEEYFAAKAQLESNRYNEFLRIQFKFREKLFSEMIQNSLQAVDSAI